jgi:hypothetical protein
MPEDIGESTSYPLQVPLLSDTADIQVALRLLSYGIESEPSADTDISADSIAGYFKSIRTSGGTPLFIQTAPTNKTATATLLASELLGQIITTNLSAAINLTFPTGTNLDSALATPVTNTAFDWYVINQTAATHSVTLVAATGHTIVGSTSVPAASSAFFRTRKTGTATYVSYRLN